MFVKALERFTCDELTGAPCWSLPKFDVFDHFLKVTVAEIFRGEAAAPPPTPTFGGVAPHPPTPHPSPTPPPS